MSQINSIHEAPVLWASVGYVRASLTHPHTAPVHVPDNLPGESRAARRVKARAAVKQRRSEVRAGVPFLQRLTTTRGAQAGRGEWQGEHAPSRLSGILGGAAS